MKILTVAVVTEPFDFEGKKRMENTVKGLENLKKYVDSLIIIPNDKIKTLVDDKTSMKEAFRFADEILKQGIRGLAELIVNPSLINLDFADVRTILKDKGVAHLGVGVAKGDNRIIEAVRFAIHSPLLETTIEGARGVILNVVGGEDLTFNEVTSAAQLVNGVVDASANIIFGARIDPNIHEEVEITIIATGFPGYDYKREDINAGSAGRYNAQMPPQDRLSVADPYYVRQQAQVANQQYPQYQPVQPQPQYPPVQAQPIPQVQTPPQQSEESIERPNDKNVPKFAQLLKNLGRRKND